MSGILNVLLAVGGLVRISDQAVGAQNKSGIGGTTIAEYRLMADGTAQKTVFPTGAVVLIPGEWLLTGAASDYEAQGTFTNNTGGSVTGPTTWTSLATNQIWTFSTTNNDASVDLTVEIRVAGAGAALASALLSMEAFSAP